MGCDWSPDDYRKPLKPSDRYPATDKLVNELMDNLPWSEYGPPWASQASQAAKAIDAYVRARIQQVLAENGL